MRKLTKYVLLPMATATALMGNAYACWEPGSAQCWPGGVISGQIPPPSGSGPGPTVTCTAPAAFLATIVPSSPTGYSCGFQCCCAAGGCQSYCTGTVTDPNSPYYGDSGQIEYLNICEQATWVFGPEDCPGNRSPSCPDPCFTYGCNKK